MTVSGRARARPKRVSPVVFGEVLHDRFPDGHSVLGGAPFNVAWHLAGLGEAPLLVSRVGDDPLGRAAREAMRNWGLSTAGLQVDGEAPTGTVDVTFNGGEPGFDIVEGVAWDAIDAADALAAAGSVDTPLLYHGSLALRSARSRDTLEALRDATRAEVLCDLNLRPPFDGAAVIESCLRSATWLKVSAGELRRLTDAPCDDVDGCRDAGGQLASDYDLRAVIVTRGGEGAVAITRAGTVHVAAAVPVARIVDTVGAGDAFTAVLARGLLREEPLPELLGEASALAARVCGLQGATTTDRSLYRGLTKHADPEGAS